MELTGVNGSGSIGNQKHTLESLNIQVGSGEASIFNQIDNGDGKEDGFLNNEQYEQFRTMVNNDEIKNKVLKILNELSKIGSKNPTNRLQKEKIVAVLNEINDKNRDLNGKLKEILDALNSNEEDLSKKTTTNE